MLEQHNYQVLRYSYRVDFTDCVNLISSIECARDSLLLPRKIVMLDSQFAFCTVLLKACILIAHPKDMSMYQVQVGICT